MSLSENIKRLRLEKNMTQEQLAVRLGVSAQAVSKWETSETYPDGPLLLPLARELDASLDELFDNNSVTMRDISKKILSLLYSTEAKERFNVARDICWQIERGMFNCHVDIGKKYDPEEIKNRKSSSYIFDNYGFTLISNGEEPFFSVFPQPEDGFGNFLKDKENLRRIFAALSCEDTLKAIFYLYKKNENYLFESAVLARDCEISDEKIDTVLENLILLQIIWKQALTINEQERILYYSRPSHKVLALFLLANEIGKNGYCLQLHSRNTPLLKE